MNIAGKKTKLWKKALIAILSLPLLAILIFFVWAGKTSNADPEKLKKFLDQNADSIVVSEYPGYWEILPKIDTCSNEECRKTVGTGLIFYPGAKVDPRAYFFKLGFLTNGNPSKIRLFITKPPLRLAFFGINQADGIIQKNPSVKKWIIGGHSLGGAMSCEYAKNNSEKVTDLFLLGAYCGSTVRDKNLNVISIHGSEDGVITPKKVADKKKNLPNSLKEYVISGMNHAQAGNYGDQSGDKPATKSDERVREEIAAILKNEI